MSVAAVSTPSSETAMHAFMKLFIVSSPSVWVSYKVDLRRGTRLHGPTVPCSPRELRRIYDGRGAVGFNEFQNLKISHRATEDRQKAEGRWSVLRFQIS